jgi:uncharacterized protein YfaS (alpha-2-macroglobulin family)
MGWKAGRTAAVAVACGVVVAAAGAAWWWNGSRSGDDGGTATVVEGATGSDTFVALDCKARLFDESPALAVTFSQPVDRRQRFDNHLQVSDLGAFSAADADTAAVSGKPVATDEVGAGNLAKGSWVVGDNPRVVYFPAIQPQRKYKIGISSGLKNASGQTLDSLSTCEVASEAMPPSFYFASKGVVLPAGQNGGLPVVTVNTPEVDVQFLRVDADNLPTFYESALGVRGPAKAAEADATADADADAGSEYDNDYGGNTGLKGTVSLWDLDRLKSMSRSVYQGRFLADATPNRRHVTFLPVETIKELKEPGIYVAVMTQPGRFRDEYQVTYFYVTDVGLHARRYPNQLDAFATSLKSGKAVGGVEFELLDGQAKSLGKAKADGQGHAVFTGDVDAARVLLGRRGNEMSVVALQEPALDLSEFDVGGYPSRNNKLFVYAGRDLYRPGERFDVSVLARNPDGAPVAAMPLTATLKRPDGRVMQTAAWRPQANLPGYVQQPIVLPADAQTGSWLLEVRLDPAARSADASWKFQVEEFLPERMKLDLQSRQQILSPGDELKVQVRGDYLYGSPAAGNRVLGVVSVQRDRLALPTQWPGFIFGDFADDSRKQRKDLEEAELDERGAVTLTVPLDVDGTHSPMKVKTSVSLLESGGRPVVRSIDRAVWPAKALIAVRPMFDRDVAREGALAEFEAVRVDAAGKFVPLDSAQLRLYREERQYYWRFDDQRGWNSGFTENEELIDSRTIALRDRIKLGLPVGYGRYRLEISDPDTGETMRYRFYAGWGAQDAEDMGNRPDRVQLKLDKAPVREGDDVTLTITPPHDGEALIAVEGDKVLWSERTSVKASGSTITIPVGKDWKRHDLYVSVAVFRPGSEGDRVTPARALGLIHLPLARDDRKLSVALTAPPKVLPEKRTTVKVKVGNLDKRASEAADQSAYVTVSAVDLGILNITRYASPDPFDFFFGKHRYAPELLDLYGKLIEKMDGTQGKLKWGGDAASRDTRSLPTKVRLVDLFSGPVKLDANGEANVPLDLPDFNGTLRIMATAFTQDRYGSAQADMVVAAPIVAELSTPRFISPGDDVTLALDVTNLSGGPQNLSIRLEGLDPVRIRDGARTVSLADKQRTTLRFGAEATGAYGLGRLRLVVDGAPAAGSTEPLHIVRESLLQVQPAVPAEREVKRARIEPGDSFRLEPTWTSRFYNESVTVGMSVSNRPPFNIGRLVQGLLDYPYGCLEQTASAAYPHVFIDEVQAKAYGLTPRTRAERERMLEGAIARIAGQQKASGGFTLWGDGAQEVWLSAYVTGFLQDARTNGFNVPDTMARRSQEWLLAQLQQGVANIPALPANLQKDLAVGTRLRDTDYDSLRNGHRRFAELANAAYVLARDQKAPLSTLRVLHDSFRNRARSPLPLVHLAVALKLMGDEARSKVALDDAMARPYGIDAGRGGGYGEWLGDYGSPVRDMAMSYALMAQNDLAHPRRELMLNDLAGRLAGRPYLSTQEQLALFLAARAAGGQNDAPWTAVLRNGAQDETLTSRTSESRTVAGNALQQGVEVINQGPGVLFVEADIQGYPTAPAEPRSNGVRIVRTWYESDGKAWTGRGLKTGDTLIVKLDATADRRIEDGLIVDRVPAGFEVENLNLTQGAGLENWSIGGKDVAEALNDPAIKHREYRDDRYVAAVRIQGTVTVFYKVRVVTPGRFVVPAPVVEDMYRPDVRGVGTQSAGLVIQDPRAAAGGAR